MKRTDAEMDALLDRMERMLDDYESAKDGESRGRWRDAYSDRLGKYEDVMKRMNGDDFDIYSKSYDEYHNDFSDMDEETYIDRLIVVMNEHLEKLKDALHTDEITVESTEDGTTVTTDAGEVEGAEEQLNEDADGQEVEAQVEEEAVEGENGSISDEEMAELEEVSKNTPRHY